MSLAAAVGSDNVTTGAGGDADLEALLQGDKAAWDRFVARHAGVIFAAVRRRLVPAGRSADAEDVVQDVFVRLCQHDFRLLRSYDSARARITTWLTVVSNSAAIDHLRRLRRRTEDIETQPESVLAVDPVVREERSDNRKAADCATSDVVTCLPSRLSDA